MKIITLHCDYIKFKPLKKAIKSIENLKSKEEVEVREPLVVLTAIEKGDDEKTFNKLIKSIEETAKEVNAKKVVLYPYAHLSSNLASPKMAKEYLDRAESIISKTLKTTKAPFGYYKSFELKVKGHPLSELSKEFSPGISSEGLIEESYDPNQLLREISRSRLDTSKLKDNDHRILGQRLDLFSFNEISPGMVFWHDSGFYIYSQIKDFITKLLRHYDYKIIATPQVLDSNLFRVSGHWKHYIDNMFLTKY